MSDLSPYSQPKPPKTITKVKDDRFLDFTSFSYLDNAFSCRNWVIPFQNDSSKPNVDRLMYLGIAFLVGNVWYKFASTDEKVQYNKDRLKFFIGDTQGKHVINSFDSTAAGLGKVHSN